MGNKKSLRLLATLMAFLMLFQAAVPALAESKIADVPPDHWAYQAIISLVEKGYLGLYDDGTFQGNKPVDRYTLAVALAKILAQVESGSVTPSEEDLKTLRNLSTEFRTELAELAKQVENLDARVLALEKQLNVTRDDLAKASARADVMEQQFKDAVAAQQQGSELQIQTLETNLKVLQEEFVSYRASSEAKITSLQKTNRILTIALAAVGLASIVFMTR